ncbi:nuclear transport factor 2 family protein [Flagellimonas algicola]|uniref:Nuclear transport factor 2 family protein n=1 Tax=Flagellimonas algicola TaxID=2583815 RepID=A0ABY2WNR1_9FLAO|nr:nuclear transport factor 2 family protein [Allomuricauda algicola]TMU56625.1 nuclear transport factor 2 family protein [Allomuricauda algicola]
MKRLGFLLFGFAFFASIDANSQPQAPNETLDPSFIFHPDNLMRNSEDLSAIYGVMAQYYEGVELGKAELLNTVFHKEWQMRDTGTPNEATLHIADKNNFVNMVKDHGPYHGYASERVFAHVGMANDNLAFVRINKAPSRSSTCFYLYKLDEGWIIMDKLWVPVREAANLSPTSESYHAVEMLLHAYFKALSIADTQVLSEILHPEWDSITIDTEGKLTIVSKEGLLQNPKTEHIDFTQLLSIDLYHDKLAIVRIDIPSQNSTSFITIFKLDGIWKITNERRATN